MKSVAIPHKVFGTSLHVVGGSTALVLFTLVVVILRIVFCCCFVCLQLVYSMLPVSLDCPFGIL